MKIIFTLLGVLLFALSLQAQFTSPNTGVRWTLDSIAAHSPSTVTISDSTYSLLEELNFEENDSLIIDKNIRLEIAAGIEVKIKGYFYCSGDSIAITAIDKENPYKGFWFYETATVYFNHTTIEYGGGLKVITPNFLMEQCEMSNNTLDRGSSTGGAISFSKGSPIVRSSTFKNNLHPALSSAANASAAVQVFDCYFEGNNQKNNNRPQINLGPSGEADSTRIIGNFVIGDPNLTMVGGISVSSLVGVTNQFVIRSNDIIGNRYGITNAGNSTGKIERNNILHNNTETNPLVGGSGISLYGTNMVMITENNIANNLWGITLIQNALANLGSDDAEDFNPGLNLFSNNGNGGITYALYNNTPNLVKALHNCWITGKYSTTEEVEDVIYHFQDDTTLGKVIYQPFECGQIVSISRINENQFDIFPNPARSSFSIQTYNDGLLEIFNMSGIKVFEKHINHGNNVITSNFTPGIYIVRLGNKSSHTVRKLIIQ